MVRFLKIVHLFYHQILPVSGSQDKEVFSANDLVYCHGQAQTVLLPYHFFLFEILVSTVGDIPTTLGFFFLELVPEALQ